MVCDTLRFQNLSEAQANHSTSHEEGLSITEIFSLCINIFILVTGVIGNGLVIFVTGYKMKTTVNSIWFLNLAIADIIFMPFLVYNIVDVFDTGVSVSGLLYKCGYFVYVLNMFASVFFLTIISLDRCLCTWVIAWTQNKRTLVKARIICVFVWILSICCSIPYIIVICEDKPEEAFGSYESYINVHMSVYIFRFTVGFLIPFLISVSSYIAIGVRVRRLKRKMLRSLWVIFSVVLAFFICWFPYHVLKLCFVSMIKNNWGERVFEEIETARPFVLCLAYLNSCLNPILYVFMCDEIKMTLKKSLLLVFEGAFTEDHLGLRTSIAHTTETPSRQMT